MAYGAEGAIDGFQLIKRGRCASTRCRRDWRAESVDPLAAFLRARAWLDQAPEGAELALSVFDGRKRYDAKLRYLGLDPARRRARDGAGAPGRGPLSSWSRR